MGCPAANVGIDKAVLNVGVTTNFSVQLLTQSIECDKCSFFDQNVVHPNSSDSLVVNTTFATLLRVLKKPDDDVICEQVQFHFGEWGEYLLTVSPSDVQGNFCKIHTVEEPVNSNLYALWAFLFYVGLATLWFGGNFAYRRIYSSVQEDERLLVTDLGSPSERSGSSHLWSFSADASVSRLRERLHSLDTFRGICITMMIFVNYGGGKYWFFQHSKWNGLTAADVVFPWFLWIMGVSTALSLQSQLRKAITKKRIFLKILRRSVVLFTVALILNSKYGLGCELSEMRVLGVLQRFSITYLVVATLQLISEKPGDVYQFECWAPLRDVVPYWYQWIFISVVVAAHTSITFLLPVPGCPTGYLGPGGLHVNSSFANCTGGAAGYIDRLVLGAHHLHKTQTFKALYDTTLALDPEGILGYLTSILVGFLGLQAGKVLTMFPVYTARVKRWLFWAVVTGVIGAVLCKLSENDGWIPINKNLWSLSFALVTSSMAFTMLTICYLLVDVMHVYSGAPFYYTGTNSILLYVGQEITASTFPWNIPVPETHLFQLCMDLWGTTLWIIISVWLYYCNFFLVI